MSSFNSNTYSWRGLRRHPYRSEHHTVPVASWWEGTVTCIRVTTLPPYLLWLQLFAPRNENSK